MTAQKVTLFNSQCSFRRIVKAISEPGVLVTLPKVAGFNCTTLATASTLLTLASNKTPLFISESIDNPLLLKTLCLQTNVPVTKEINQAYFALLSARGFNHDLMQFSCGSETEPEKSAIIILEVESMHDGKCLKLRGPGIKTHRIISPLLPRRVIKYLCKRPHSFPMGLDFLFTYGKKLLAIPRTTHVEEC